MTALRIPTHNVDGLPSGSICAYCGSMVCGGECAIFTAAEVGYTDRLIAAGVIDGGRRVGEVPSVPISVRRRPGHGNPCPTCAEDPDRRMAQLRASVPTLEHRRLP